MNSEAAGLLNSPWESHYTGEASDYEPPDPDILELVAGLVVGRALDVGCGAGGLCVELTRRGWTVTGIDLTSKAVSAARRAAEERGVAAAFITADAAVWQPEGSYDLVTCNFGLPPEPDKRSAVYAMMRRAVAPGGVVVLKIGDACGRRMPHPFAGYESLNIDDLQRGFAGFEVLSVKKVETPAHGHALPKRDGELWTASTFMAQRPST